MVLCLKGLWRKGCRVVWNCWKVVVCLDRGLLDSLVRKWRVWVSIGLRLVVLVKRCCMVCRR